MDYGFVMDSNEVVSIFLHAIVLETDNPTECVDNPTFSVNTPTKPILAVLSPTIHLVLLNSRTIDTVVKTSVS